MSYDAERMERESEAGRLATMPNERNGNGIDRGSEANSDRKWTEERFSYDTVRGNETSE